MKKLILYFLFSIFFFGNSQNIKLTEKQWFVVEIADVDGGNAIEFSKDPSNFPFTSLSFSTTGLLTSSNYLVRESCEKGLYAHVNYIGSDLNASFSFMDITPINIVDNCISEDVAMQNFMDLYINFFNDFSNDTFNYFIMDVYGVDNLIIENSSGRRIWFTENPTEYVPDELAHTWYLHKTIINGEEFIPPNGMQYGFTNIVLDISNYYSANVNNHELDINQTFTTSTCNYNQSIFDLDNTNQQFYLYEWGATMDDCGETTSANYSNQYLNIFYGNSLAPFSYEIDEDNLLTITNAVGNKAIYGQNSLSVNENYLTNLLIYPNPVQNMLNIANAEIDSVVIFNNLGQLIGNYKESKIDLSNFDKGIYFAKISLSSGIVEIQKIIKN